MFYLLLDMGKCTPLFMVFYIQTRLIPHFLLWDFGMHIYGYRPRLSWNRIGLRLAVILKDYLDITQFFLNFRKQ